jgi:hypothetical protein
MSSRHDSAVTQLLHCVATGVPTRDRREGENLGEGTIGEGEGEGLCLCR